MSAAGAQAQIIARLLDQRRTWVPLPDRGIEVQVQRPAEAEMQPYLVQGDDGRTTLRAALPQVQGCVVGWRRMVDGKPASVTEADLLGAAIGSDEAVPFDAGLWAVLVADRHAWVQAVAQAVLQAINDHYQAQADARGN